MTLVLLLIFGAADAGIKSFCNSKSDKGCGASWSPVEGLDSSLLGYDLTAGDPFATGFIEDPGLRKKIFNLTGSDSDDGYAIEQGINVREYLMCDERLQTSLATNLFQYYKNAKTTSLIDDDFNIGIEAEENGENEGNLPLLTNLAWRKNPNHKHLGDFFTILNGGAVSVSQAQCILYKVEISQFLTPRFHQTFVETLKYMERQDSEVRQLRAFKRFIRDYGTHYLSSTFLGNKVTATSFFTSFERLKYGRETLGKCAEVLAEKELKLSEEDEEEKDLKDSVCESLNDKISLHPDKVIDRTRKSIFGSPLPETGIKDWSKELNNITPIRYQLSPVVNLFTLENLDERYNISSARILDWFLPFYLKYCKVFNTQCYPPSGCGYDDICSFNEKCVWDQTSKRGYYCQATSWADISNWPQYENAGNKESTPPNIKWFREKDTNNDGSLSLEEVYSLEYPYNSWHGRRYQTALEKLFNEADLDGNQLIDNAEYINLHKAHPWYSEQVSFVILNEDNDKYLTKEEFFEATKASPDIQSMNFNARQLENLVNGLIAIGDENEDGKIVFDEYVKMSNDVFVDNFAPKYLKRIFRN